jgi:uncharacterized protein (TIGR04255 family)
MVTELPIKLKQDAIVEAILEIRFVSNELGEIVVGRLSDASLWSGYTTNRLGSSNLPEVIREADESLRYSPVIERRSQNGADSARVGSHVISYHAYMPYPGWDEFHSRLNSVVELLFEKLPSVSVKRLGFRYVNFILSSKHEVSGFSELSLAVDLKGEKIDKGVNLNLGGDYSDMHRVMSKIASKDFVALNVVPEDLVCVIDVDVFTPAGYSTNNAADVNSWIDSAHIYEKQAFFSFLTEETINKLKEE